MERCCQILASRHGESERNVAKKQNPAEEQRYDEATMYLPDCDITPKGKEQAQAAGVLLKSKIEDIFGGAVESKQVVVVSSPLRRALQTTQHVVKSCFGSIDRVSVVSDCTEIMVDACDIGTTRRLLEKEFSLYFDFGLLGDDLDAHWWPHGQSLQVTWELLKKEHPDGLESDEMVEQRMSRLASSLRKAVSDLAQQPTGSATTRLQLSL